jgi:hypothetical protein
VVAVLVGWVVDRLAVCWPVSWEVVVAVDMGTCGLLEGWMKGPAAKTAARLVAAQAWKTLWLVTFFRRWEARSATEAAMEPPVTTSRNERAKITGLEGRFLSGRGMGPRGVPHRAIEEQKEL